MITGGLSGMLGPGGMRSSMGATAASRDAARSVRETRENAREVESIDERIDKLVLVCTSLWELLKERTDLSEEDLMSKVHEVDLRDGTADGKITVGLQKCHKCGRTMSPKHRRCLYCGAEGLNKDAFGAAAR
jgi:ribosomal protein L32